MNSGLKKLKTEKFPLHWEGDLVKGVRRKNQPALMTLTERTTRFEVVIKIPDYRASTCQRLLQKEIDRHPNWFKSITFDNGSEFADMTKIKGCQIYFASSIFSLGKRHQMRTAMDFCVNSSLRAKA